MDFEFAFEQAHAGMTYVSADGRYLRANKAFLEMLGYTWEELSRLSVREITHPDHRGRDVAAFADMGSGRITSYETEKRYLRKDGSAVWVHLRVSTVRERADSPAFYFSTVADITEKRRVEAQLRESQGLFATMFAAAKVGMAVSSLDRSFSKVNPAFAVMLGYTEDELLRLSALDVIHPDDRAKTLEYFEQFVSGRKNYYRMETRYLHKAGHVVWTRASVSRLWHSSDETTNYQLTVCDNITELREAEQHLQEQRAKIASSSKLTALGEMAGGIAHEINNPIAIIYGSAQQAREVIGDDEVSRGVREKLVERIERTALRVANIVKALRNLSRDGELDSLRAAPVHSVFEDALELCREKMRNAGIELRFEVPADLAIECRPTQISQVILNLLTNAYDAVQEVDQRWIEVKAEHSGDRVRISVGDSGPGVPPALREKILEPFFTTKAIGKGTGLGLSISRSIVSQHGGTLTLDTTSPSTLFVIELPAAVADSPTALAA